MLKTSLSKIKISRNGFAILALFGALAILLVVPQCKRKQIKKVSFAFPGQSTKEIEREPLRKKFDSEISQKNKSKMSIKELEEARAMAVALRRKDSIQDYTERLVSSAPDEKSLRKYKLELADLHFDNGKLEKAAKHYNEFVSLYPGSSNAEEAHYKAILSSFYLTLDSDRDQSTTYDTIVLADNFLERSGVYNTYNDEVKNVRSKCYGKIFDNEAGIVTFNLNGKNLKAAEARMATIEKKILPNTPDRRIDYLELECKIAAAAGHDDILERKTKVILAALTDDEQSLSKFIKRSPYHKKMKLAQGRGSSYVSRF